MKIEWVNAAQLNPAPFQPTMTGHEIPVVRLPEVDAVIAEAVRMAEVCRSVGEIQFRTCALSNGARDRIDKFLTSTAVDEWRKRQEAIERICPSCASTDIERRHHAPGALPECWYWECNECTHQWGHS